MTLPRVTGLKGSVHLRPSEPNKTGQGLQQRKSAFIFSKWSVHGHTGDLRHKDPAPGWLPGVHHTGEESLIVLTKGVGILVIEA